jgi:hypothetical protein
MKYRTEWREHDEHQFGGYSRWLDDLHLIVDRYDSPEADEPGGWYGYVVTYSPSGGVVKEWEVDHSTCFDSLSEAKDRTERWAEALRREALRREA